MQLLFFSELILHKCSVEGYVPGSTRACVDKEHPSLLWMSLLDRVAFFGGVPCTRVDRYRAPNPVRLVGGLCLGCAKLCDLGLFVERGQVVRVSNDSDRDQQAQKVWAVESASGCWNVTFRPCKQRMKFCMGQSGA